jgi:hypothetical protein
MKRALLLLPLLALSCVSHKPYRVTDLSTGQIYYTEHLRRGLTTGNVYLIELKTGAEVTLRSSKVEKLTKAEIEKETAKK